MIDLGIVRHGSTIRIPFSSFDKDDGSSITMTNYAAADILVYKDGSTTERASTAGFTATTDFDAKTGKHLAIIDLADNTTADFFKAGSEYHVAIDAVTVDAVTTGGWIARFRIGQPNAWFDTGIATLASQTSFTLTAGPAEDDALNDHWAIIHDAASAVQCARVQISDYTGSTKTVTLAAGATFTVAAGDNFSLMGPMPIQVTVTGRKLDVSTGGEAGLDWANVGSPTTTLALTGTTIATTQKVDIETIKTNPVVNAGTVTFPTTATLASTTNITAATGIVLSGVTHTGAVIPTVTTTTTATNLTNAPTAGDLTATMKTSVTTAATAATPTISTLGANTITAASIAADAGVEIASAVWDRVLTAANHNIANSAGRRLRAIDAAFEVHSGTAASGAAGTITLDGAASATNDIYNGDRVVITAGTGIGEHGIILDYDGGTKVATMSKNWVTTPDNTSEFTIVPADCDIELWNGAPVTGDGDWAELQTDVDAILVDTGTTLDGRIPAALVSGRMDASAGAIAANAITAASIASDAGAEIADAVWDEATSGHSTAGTTGKALTDAGSAGDPWGTALPGAYSAGTAGKIVGDALDAAVTSRLSSAGYTAPLDAAGTRTAIGLASANLDTQLNALPTTAEVNAEVDTALADVGLTTTITGRIDAAMTTRATPAQILTTALTEAYAADGVAPTLSQLLFLVQQALTEFSIAGTTITAKKLDGSTTAATFTLDDGTNPTSRTRAT